MPLTNKELGLYLQSLRESFNYSTRDVDNLSKVSQSYISMIENGNRKPSAIVLKKLAPVYKVDYLDLYEKAGYVDLAENIKKQNKATLNTNIPVLGNIPAGIPMEMIEDIGEFESISEDMLKGGKEYFALKIDEENGHSMEPEYKPGDVLIVLKQNTCENGDDCIIAVNGDDATFKRVFKNENGIILQPLNSNYPPIIYSNEDVISKPVRILGIVVEFRRTKRKV